MSEMHVRREMAAGTLAAAGAILADWEERLRNPPNMVVSCDGVGNALEVAEVAEGAMVVQAIGEEETIKLRAELSAIATSLEGLAAT